MVDFIYGYNYSFGYPRSGYTDSYNYSFSLSHNYNYSLSDN